MAIGAKKTAPDFLIKWEKENNISSYRWVDETVTDIKTNKKIIISSKRMYGIDNKQQLINFPKEIKDYFENKTIPEVKTDKKK